MTRNLFKFDYILRGFIIQQLFKELCKFIFVLFIKSEGCNFVDIFCFDKKSFIFNLNKVDLIFFVLEIRLDSRDISLFLAKTDDTFISLVNPTTMAHVILVELHRAASWCV